MSIADPNDPPVVESIGPPCRNLRHKGMYVYTDGSGSDSNDDYDSHMYWCLKTMKGFGPDDDFVGAEPCRLTARSCYEPS
jgi:hypothetical protein